MKILAISSSTPLPDQSSGDLRFHSMLSILGGQYDVTLVVNSLGPPNSGVKDSEAALARCRVRIYDGDVYSALKTCAPEIVIFEFYYMVNSFVKLARKLAPHAIIVADSVDIHFNRLLSKAALSGHSHDRREATEVKKKELTAYASADLIIAVSDKDKKILLGELPKCQVAVLPNVHTIHPRVSRAKRNHGQLIFVGGFQHEPNVDAIIYFVSEVLPLIERRKPNVELLVIGSKPPDEVMKLARSRVKVYGFVQDTAPFLQAAYISIAPLRFGGGLKGKVGEALSHGLPVVTTKFGAEGFGLKPDIHLLVADTATEFADAVIRLLQDDALYDRLSVAGYEFVEERYSTKAMSVYINNFISRAATLRPMRLPVYFRFREYIKSMYDQHFRWRINS